MIHELKQLISQAKAAHVLQQKSVFVSVVALEGSSYRRPGVRMLILEDGTMVGAVSGGCVEKEILRQAQSVFNSEEPKLITYDGRYRLGCEGMLYILLEPFSPESTFFKAFETQCNSRNSFEIKSYFSKEEADRYKGGSEFIFSNGSTYPLSTIPQKSNLKTYIEEVPCPFRLLVIGNEHDAVKLCQQANLVGWEVTIYSPNNDSKSIENFPGATHYFSAYETEFSKIHIDAQTAIVLMTHSFAKDLNYLLELHHKTVAYIGLLGPKKRREQLLDKVLELQPEITHSFFDSLYGPAGLNIGAESPEEIAISVIAEILSVIRNQATISLRDKTSGIHQ